MPKITSWIAGKHTVFLTGKFADTIVISRRNKNKTYNSTWKRGCTKKKSKKIKKKLFIFFIACLLQAQDMLFWCRVVLKEYIIILKNNLKSFNKFEFVNF